ncbi:dipeptide ABC transporter ATP-binding protein [Cryobacterium sp. MLB-32]|uniref:dipeptide ABC transporter ATP-binding protein n=1 Tax=Cryobacterium sp. MLB-32 TaxID=1529318 RepID=UPI00068DA3CE|nr:dipeptide ABC transporter ATP-binding protein [Cryobacterium sp. MLB-32]
MTDLSSAARATGNHSKARTPLLEVADLSVTFPQRGGADVHAVRGISYQVNEGEFLGIVGESGSGKSVSSLALMGLLPSSAVIDGTITFGGRALLDLNDRELSKIRGREIAMIFQDPLSAMTPVYTVGDQIAEALLLHDAALSKKAARARAVELLTVVGIPDPERRAKAFPHEFSGGMRQRAMIAMSIANDPRLIVADEPTTALDVTIQAQILEVLETAKELTGAAVVLITHDLGVVAGHADRIAVMYAGKLVENGTTADVFAEPHMPYTIGLLRSVPNMQTAGTQRLVPLEGRPPSLTALPRGCPFAARCPIAIDVCREIEPELAQHGTATGNGAADIELTGEVAATHVAACHRSAEIATGTLTRVDIFPRPAPLAVKQAETRVEDGPVLTVSNLVRHFPLTKGGVFSRRIGTVRAVDGVSFSLAAGQTLGLVGESGCGKSTTILEILEMSKPQGGQILIDGKDVATLNRAEKLRLRKEVQIVFQDPMAAIDPRLPIGDIIGEPLTVHGVKPEAIRQRVRELLDLVGLDPVMADRYPHEFSGGQRQRIGIARALATNPRLVVLDEPVSALDVSIQAGVINLLEDLKEQLGLSYLFVAHDLAIVRQIADMVAVMYLGRIVEYGPVAEVFSNPRHPYTQALISAAPIPDPVIERSRQRVLLEGDLPSPTEHIDGCNFRSRCPLFTTLDADKQALCASADPHLTPHGTVEAACHHVELTQTDPTASPSSTTHESHQEIASPRNKGESQ